MDLHAEYFAIDQGLNTLNQAMLAGASPEQLTRMVDIVVDFHEAHFAHEELAFADCGYQHRDAHMSDHQIMLKRLRDARNEIRGGTFEAALSVSNLLYAFHNHVVQFDGDAHAHLLRQSMESAEILHEHQVAAIERCQGY